MKQYYMFISVDIDKNKKSRFVVETDGIPKGATFYGKVVARNKKAYYNLGAESDVWINPIHDLQNGCKPSFIPINMEDILNKFEEHVFCQ